MSFILFSVFSCAFVCSPVQGALQAAMREGSRAGQPHTDTDGGLGSYKAVDLPQEPQCNADSGIVLAGCTMHKTGSKMGVPPLSIISPPEAPSDIAKEMAAGQEQHAFGVYSAAAVHYTKARELAKEVEDMPKLAEASQHLAEVWLLQGKLTEALDELLTTLARTRSSALLHALANVHREMGHLSKALELYEEAKGLESVSAQLFIDMGEAHVRLGSLDTAAMHVQEAFNISEKALNSSEKESLDAACAHSLDGFIYLSRGDALGGQQRLDKALSIQARSLRPGHPDLVATQMHYARALRDFGIVHAALAATESLEQTLRSLKSEDLQLSRALTQKADFLHELGRLADAQAAMEEVFSLQGRIFNHQAVPEVASALNIYGSILHDKGDASGAKSQYVQALAMNLDTVGKWHPETAAVHNSLGTWWEDNGNLFKASHHFETCLAIQHETLGENNPEVASTYSNLASLAVHQGNLTDARAHLERALSLLDAAHVPEQSPDRKAYSVNLQSLMLLQSEPGAGEPVLTATS